MTTSSIDLLRRPPHVLALSCEGHREPRFLFAVLSIGQTNSVVEEVRDDGGCSERALELGKCLRSTMLVMRQRQCGVPHLTAEDDVLTSTDDRLAGDFVSRVLKLMNVVPWV